jgi:hypothetical protein
MAKKVREQNKWTIPSDWDEETDGYQLAVICVPNSRQWRGIFIGQISDLSYGRNYNRLTGTITGAQEIARDIFESMTMTCLDDVIIALQCVCSSMTTLAEKSGDTEQEIDPPLSDGTVGIGPGEQFPDQEAYFDAKCNVANGIYDTVLETVQWLEDNNVDLLAGTFGGITSGLIVALLGAGPVGWAIVLVASATAGLASFLIRYSVNFFDLKTALGEVHDECVLALYNAGTGFAARANFITEAENATQPITPIESDLLELLLSNKMVNQLFEPRSDLEDYVSPDPVDCGAAILQVWDFDSDVEGWTFIDQSDPGSSATRSYDAIEEAIENEIVVASLPNTTARGENSSPTVSIPITPGASVQADFGPTSDEGLQAVRVFAVYDDATQETTQVITSTSGTLVLTLTQSKTIETIIVDFARSTSGTAMGSTYNTDLLEVRIIGL